MKKIKVILLALVLALISATGGSLYALYNTEISSNIIKNITPEKYIENDLATGVEKIYDATVLIEAYKDGSLYSTGTGFVYKKDNKYGYIITNNHVISEATDVKIVMSNKETVDSKILGKETYSDIAVLEIDKDKVLQVATIGDYEKVNQGDTIFTIGSPEGAEYFNTVTKGVISAKDRLVAVSFSTTSSDYYMKVMQTDAAINPGNSGGPICNENGEVIGVTNMKLVDDNVEGMGFAIPIDDAIDYASILESGDNIKRPYVGISMLDITNDYYLWQNNITLPDGITEGVAIVEVAENSPASNAKLKKGDIIIELAGEKITGVADFRYVLYKQEIGKEVKIKINRSGKVITKTITPTENKN